MIRKIAILDLMSYYDITIFSRGNITTMVLYTAVDVLYKNLQLNIHVNNTYRLCTCTPYLRLCDKR